MKLRPLLLVAVAGLLATTAPSQDKKEGKADPPSERSPAKVSRKEYEWDLQFTEDGKDLVVRLMIEGPKARQVILTNYRIDDGQVPWDAPDFVDRTPHPPRVELRFLVLTNRDLPGFRGGDRMEPRELPEVRKQQRSEVVWRLPNYRNWGFRRQDATFAVEPLYFDASSEDLRQALPRFKRTIDAAEERKKELDKIHHGPP
jgi:hypothetical protein